MATLLIDMATLLSACIDPILSVLAAHLDVFLFLHGSTLLQAVNFAVLIPFPGSLRILAPGIHLCSFAVAPANAA